MLRTETERRDLSTAPSTVERSTEGERQPPEYLPTAVSQLTAAQTEDDGGGDATASEPQPTSPLGSTRTMLRTEREHRDSSVSLEGPSDGQRASFGQPSPEISALEEQAEMQHRLDDQARQLREPREAITTSAPDGPSEMESSEGDENSVTKHPSTSETPASLPPPMLPTPLPPSPHPGGGVVVTAPTSTDANEQGGREGDDSDSEASSSQLSKPEQGDARALRQTPTSKGAGRAMRAAARRAQANLAANLAFKV